MSRPGVLAVALCTLVLCVFGVTVNAKAAGTLVFDDEFNGPAGSPPDPSTWAFPSWTCDNDPNALDYCLKPSNAVMDGIGNLVLKVTAPGTQGRPYDGVRVSTWVPGSWPPRIVLASVAPHVWIEARIKYAGDAGVWGGFWPQSVTESSRVLELDVSEVRLAYPSEAGCHVHGVLPWDGAAAVDSVREWHTYAVDYWPDHVTFYTDNIVCGQVYFPSDYRAPRLGMQLENKIGMPGTWGGAGAQLSADGRMYEADMLVDYIRAYAVP
jgi:beta-glucanase (GH16 family)